MTRASTIAKKIWRRRKRRLLRVRTNIFGTASRPRLCVFRSHKHFYAQIIDDERAVTLCACSTLSKELRQRLKNTSNIQAAAEVGKEIAKIALSRGIKKVVLDRRHYRYHGRVKAFAQAAREAGLEF